MVHAYDFGAIFILQIACAEVQEACCKPVLL